MHEFIEPIDTYGLPIYKVNKVVRERVGDEMRILLGHEMFGHTVWTHVPDHGRRRCGDRIPEMSGGRHAAEHPGNSRALSLSGLDGRRLNIHVVVGRRKSVGVFLDRLDSFPIRPNQPPTNPAHGRARTFDALCDILVREAFVGHVIC
jgi:hypothetical protein